ncbi:hypothetical protein GN956_G22225 [Arapaima gigas]
MGGPPAASLAAAAALLWLASCSEVQELTKHYQCRRTGGALVVYEEKNITGCQQTWSLGQTLFAIYSTEKICTPPCVKVSSGTVVLDTCEDVTLTFFCETSAGRVAETRVHFTGIDSRMEEVKNHPGTTKGTEGPAGPPGSSGLGEAVVAVIVALTVGVSAPGTVILWCYRQQQRPTQSVSQVDPLWTCLKVSSPLLVLLLKNHPADPSCERRKP